MHESTDYKDIQKPFLKWVGGKTQIIEQILSRIQKSSPIRDYHEPFVGGGSVLFGVLSLRKKGLIDIQGYIYAYDANRTLIDAYRHVQTVPDALYDLTKYYVDKYNNILVTSKRSQRDPCMNEHDALLSKDNYYYWLRKRFNDITNCPFGSLERSALFIFLNKTCFRGLYREGPKGFNVAYGHYRQTPYIIDKAQIHAISELIKGVRFIHTNFQSCTTVWNETFERDFVYIDPPYAPESSKSFVDYVSSGFGYETHIELFKKIKSMTQRGVRFLMSNSNVQIVHEQFDDKRDINVCNGISPPSMRYHIDEVKARRSINSKNPGSMTTEILVYNW